MSSYKNLCDFLKDELNELDRRAKEKKLTNNELAYGDQVAALAYHLKKLEAEESRAETESYRTMRGSSMRAYRDGGDEREYMMSYRGGNNSGRYAGNAYHGDNKEMLALVDDMMARATDEHTRREIENLRFKLEEM